MRTVPVRVLSWVSEDTGKGFLSISLRVSIASVWDSESTMTRQDVRSCVEGYPSHLSLDASFKLESV